MPVDVRPSRLDHTDFGIGEVMNGTQEKIFRGNEVGIKDRHKLTLGCFQAIRECPSFKAFTIATMVVSDGMTERSVALHQAAGHSHGFVRRIVQNLDIKLLARVIEAADCVHEPLDYVLLIEYR